jgi:hypothetical protein
VRNSLILCSILTVGLTSCSEGPGPTLVDVLEKEGPLQLHDTKAHALLEISVADG